MFGFQHVLTTLNALWAVLSSSTDEAVTYYRAYVSPYLFEPFALVGPSPPPALATYLVLSNDGFAHNQGMTMTTTSRTQITTLTVTTLTSTSTAWSPYQTLSTLPFNTFVVIQPSKSTLLSILENSTQIVAKLLALALMCFALLLILHLSYQLSKPVIGLGRFVCSTIIAPFRWTWHAIMALAKWISKTATNIRFLNLLKDCILTPCNSILSRFLSLSQSHGYAFLYIISRALSQQLLNLGHFIVTGIRKIHWYNMTVTVYRSISSMIRWIIRPCPSTVDWFLISTSRSVPFSIAAAWSFINSISAHWRRFLASQCTSTTTQLWSKIIIPLFQVFPGTKVVESLNDQIRELKEEIAMRKAQLEHKDYIIAANNKEHADEMAKERERFRDERANLLHVQLAQGTDLARTDRYRARAEYAERQLRQQHKKAFEQQAEAHKRDEAAQRELHELASQFERTKTALATSEEANQEMQGPIQQLSSSVEKSEIKIQTLLADNARLNSNVQELGAENARLKHNLQSAFEQNEHVVSAHASLRSERDVAVESLEIIARQKTMLELELNEGRFIENADDDEMDGVVKTGLPTPPQSPPQLPEYSDHMEIEWHQEKPGQPIPGLGMIDNGNPTWGRTSSNFGIWAPTMGNFQPGNTFFLQQPIARPITSAAGSSMPPPPRPQQPREPRGMNSMFGSYGSKAEPPRVVPLDPQRSRATQPPAGRRVNRPIVLN